MVDLSIHINKSLCPKMLPKRIVKSKWGKYLKRQIQSMYHKLEKANENDIDNLGL